MKKKRLLIALAVLLGAGACVLPWRDEVWLAVSYERHEYDGIVFYTSRIPWLRDPFVPDQECPECSNSRDYERQLAEGLLEGGRFAALGRSWKSEGLTAEEMRLRRLEFEILPEHCSSWKMRVWNAFPLEVETEQGRRIELDAGSWNCLCPTCHPERQ